MNPAKPTSPCPRCSSARLHHSHRRGAMDRVLAHLGAELKRCHDCRHRFAFFKLVTLPLGGRDNRDGLSGKVLLSSVFTLCLLLVLWMVRRLGMQG